MDIHGREEASIRKGKKKKREKLVSGHLGMRRQVRTLK